ncbi:MAG: sugar phosphate nucleotidyltransferase [Desulfurococcaceae archaeon]
MKGILLAAGEGTRLRPITETRPKAMIPVLCKPLLEWHVESLLNTGVEEVVIVVGHMKNHIVKFLESRGYFNGKVKVLDQKELRGTGDAIIKASEYIGLDEDVIVAYSDLFVEDWSIYAELLKEENNAIIGVKVGDPQNYGVLYLHGSHLKKIIEKPEKPESNIVNAGIYKLNTRDILENGDIPPSPRGEIEATDIINKIAAKKPVKVLMYEKNWIDVGKPWHVIEANKVALQHIDLNIKGRVVEPVHISGKVHIDSDSVIHPFTTIQGPVYIGRHVEIGPNAYIRPWTVICDYSKIGFSVEVKESVLFENVHAHHLAYIGDSVICENVNLGAGTILANLRHDNKSIKMMIKGILEDTGRRKLGAIIGANSKTGVNVSINPGIKIGSNSWILPGTVVYRDVPSNTIYPSKSTDITE